MRLYKGCPFVFGGGIIEKPAEERDEVHREPPRGNGGGNDHHYVDRSHLPAPKSASGQLLGNGIDKEREQEKQKQRCPSGKVRRHRGST